VASVSTSTGSASEAGCPDDEVPTTCNLSWPGWACGTTTEVWNFPSELITADPTTTRLGPSTTILTRLSGLKPAPLNGTRWPAWARLGADTIGEAEIPGGDCRVVDVVWGLGAVVVVVLLEVVEVGAAVEVVDGGTVVPVVALVGGEATVVEVAVMGGPDAGMVSGVVRRVGFTRFGRVVDVVEVDVVLVPLTVLGGVFGTGGRGDVVVVEVLGVAPGGVCGTVVLVVGGLVVLVCSPAGAPVEEEVPVVVVEDVDVLADGVVVELVALVTAVDVVVDDVVVVTEDVGTVVVVSVVLGVVVVRLVLLVVVAAVVVVTEDEGGSKGEDNGVDSDVVSAPAAPSGTTAIAKPSPVTNSALQNVARSRAGHLLEL
jgi:hypothetical protein